MRALHSERAGMKPYLIEIAFFSAFLIATGVRTGLLTLRRHRLALAMVADDPEELLFHEHGVQAFSDNGLLCDFSHHTLELVLTRSEFWLRDGARAADRSHERLCTVVLSSIRSIQRQGKFIKIDFLGNNGVSDALLLRLSDRQGFVDQLTALVSPAPLLPAPMRLFKRSAVRETSL